MFIFCSKDEKKVINSYNDLRSLFDKMDHDHKQFLEPKDLSRYSTEHILGLHNEYDFQEIRHMVTNAARLPTQATFEFTVLRDSFKKLSGENHTKVSLEKLVCAAIESVAREGASSHQLVREMEIRHQDTAVTIKDELVESIRAKLGANSGPMNVDQMYRLLNDPQIFELLKAFDVENTIALYPTTLRQLAHELQMDPLATSLFITTVGEPLRASNEAWWHGDRQKLQFLVGSFRENCYWFEIVEFTQKLILAGLLVFFPQGSLTQMYFAMLIAIVMLTISAILQPFTDSGTNMLKITVQLNLVITLLCMIMLQVELGAEILSKSILDAVLVCSNLLLAPLPAYYEVIHFVGRWLTALHEAICAVARSRRNNGIDNEDSKTNHIADDVTTKMMISFYEYCSATVVIFCEKVRDQNTSQNQQTQSAEPKETVSYANPLRE